MFESDLAMQPHAISPRTVIVSTTKEPLFEMTTLLNHWESSGLPSDELCFIQRGWSAWEVRNSRNVAIQKVPRFFLEKLTPTIRGADARQTSRTTGG